MRIAVCRSAAECVSAAFGSNTKTNAGCCRAEERCIAHAREIDVKVSFSCVMFCLDFAAAFIVHYQLASRFGISTQSDPLFTFTSGALSGATAAVALYPFDIVRQMTVAPGTSHFAFSTIPFMTAYLGIYMMQPQSERRQKPFKNKLAWAVASTTVAAAVEFPFDRAKHSMAGSLRAAAFANAFRIPLGSLMLIACVMLLINFIFVTNFVCSYDQILSAGNDRRASEAE